mmetsp:Transcript_60066/g.143076  ORF Transcript_60066/g.143076 Transcript_60066/m.143076 type:complete len:248 (-) Transcript_60066:1113-1856(-)
MHMNHEVLAKSILGCIRRPGQPSPPLCCVADERHRHLNFVLLMDLVCSFDLRILAADLHIWGGVVVQCIAALGAPMRQGGQRNLIGVVHVIVRIGEVGVAMPNDPCAIMVSSGKEVIDVTVARGSDAHQCTSGHVVVPYLKVIAVSVSSAQVVHVTHEDEMMSITRDVWIQRWEATSSLPTTQTSQLILLGTSAKRGRGAGIRTAPLLQCHGVTSFLEASAVRSGLRYLPSEAQDAVVQEQVVVDHW